MYCVFPYTALQQVQIKMFNGYLFRPRALLRLTTHSGTPTPLTAHGTCYKDTSIGPQMRHQVPPRASRRATRTNRRSPVFAAMRSPAPRSVRLFSRHPLQRALTLVLLLFYVFKRVIVHEDCIIRQRREMDKVAHRMGRGSVKRSDNDPDLEHCE